MDETVKAQLHKSVMAVRTWPLTGLSALRPSQATR